MDIIEKYPEHLKQKKALMFGFTPIILSMQPPTQSCEAYSKLKQTLYHQLEDEIHFFAPLPESQPNYLFLARQKMRLNIKQMLIWLGCLVVVGSNNFESIQRLILMVHQWWKYHA